MEQYGSILSRRDFVRMAAISGTVAALSPGLARAAATVAKAGDPIPMIALPYAENALEPFVSAKTVNIHYNQHHRSYWNLVSGWAKSNPEYKGQTLEQLISKTRGGVLLDESVYYISILLYNHNLYWPSMKPGGGGVPHRESGVAKGIDKAFGSYDAFRKKFIAEAMKLGSGWVFLVNSADGLALMWTDYHDSPLAAYFRPLIALDVWEHAYYLDYLNDRQKYVNVFLDKLVNWDFAEKNLALDIKR